MLWLCLRAMTGRKQLATIYRTQSTVCHLMRYKSALTPASKLVSPSAAPQAGQRL